jgi:hypothetical protein
VDEIINEVDIDGDGQVSIRNERNAAKMDIGMG